MELPLAGVRVLDLTRLLPGDHCTWMLAMLGADVLKIEDPGAGDYVRTFGAQIGGASAVHHLVNRAKRSVVIDLKDPGGRELFERLVPGVDALVESFRPGVMDRLGLGYPELKELNPALVFASLSGFGATGPMAGRPVHDPNYLAFDGFLDRLGHAGQAPPLPPIPLADLVGGGFLPTIGIVSLLLRARETGRGAHLDAAMVEGMTLLPHLIVADLLSGAQVPGRGEYDWAGGFACYGVYPCADGYVAVAAVETVFWERLCNALDLDGLIGIQYDRGKQDEIRGQLERRFQEYDVDLIEEELVPLDCCVSVVRSYEEMLASDQATARGYVRDVAGFPMAVLAPPFVIDGERPPETNPAPTQGEHTFEVLREFSIEMAELEELAERGAIRQADA